ncbi:MAG: branched-chain amino acid ABC transporter permease [Burkholderiales bacterium]|nr:branched-chain amino acid ABC transporter permease [Burkholderiales bacterium]
MNLIGPRIGVAPGDYVQAAAWLDSGERRLGLALLGGALIAFPFVVSEYLVFMACVAGMAVVSIVGLNILTGYTGLLSIGHAAFNGIGAYACAIAAAKFGAPFWIAIPAGGLAAAAAGVLVGLPSLRIKGLYLAIATLAAQYMFLFVAQHWESVTGGDRGFQVTPASVAGVRLDSDFRLYWLIMPVTVLMCAAAANLFRTRVGRAFIAVRERDYSAEVLGIDLLRTKLAAFAIASFYAGIAGALMAYFFKVVNPEQYTFTASIFQLTAIIVGGLGSVLGSVLGALFMVAVPELLKVAVSAFAGADQAKSAIMLASARELVFGLLIVGFLLFEPFGLAEIVRRARAALTLWPFRT